MATEGEARCTSSGMGLGCQGGVLVLALPHPTLTALVCDSFLGCAFRGPLCLICGLSWVEAPRAPCTEPDSEFPTERAGGGGDRVQHRCHAGCAVVLSVLSVFSIFFPTDPEPPSAFFRRELKGPSQGLTNVVAERGSDIEKDNAGGEDQFGQVPR